MASIAWPYDSRCPRYAKYLKDAADDYESALSEYEDAKSNFESACDSSFGYSSHDVSACGRNGYERSAYQQASEDLRTAQEELKNALGSANYSCRSHSQSTDPMNQACLIELAKTKDALRHCDAN